MKCEFCNNEMKVKNFTTKAIVYCNECHNYRQDNIECNHNFKYYLFELESGGKQLRAVCTICYFRDPKIFKQTPELLLSAVNKMEKSFTDFNSKRTSGEYDEIFEFTKQFRIEQNKDKMNNYYDYIDSELWKETREPILIRDNYTCQICGNPACSSLKLCTFYE